MFALVPANASASSKPPVILRLGASETAAFYCATGKRL
jgi:hypothetical protein